MAQIFRDEFAGPDGQLLENYNAAWVRSTLAAASGTSQLLGSRARQSTTATSVYCRSDVQAETADYDVSAGLFFASAANSPSVGVCGRMTGPGGAALTFYQVRLVNNGSGLVLARFVNNNAITLLSQSMNFGVGAEPKITLRMRGDQISALLDDVTILGPVADATITARGYTGLRFASASTDQIRVDNFTVDTPDQGVSGALSSTTGDVGMSSSGAVIVSGVLASALDNAGMAAGGTVGNSPSGALASQLSGASMSGAGAVLNRGAFSSALAGAEMSAAGTVALKPSGALASTLAGASMFAAGYLGDEPPANPVRPYRWRVMRRHQSTQGLQ